MSTLCAHLDQIRAVSPKTDGCEECLQMGDTRVARARAWCAATWAAATPLRTGTRQITLKGPDTRSSVPPGMALTGAGISWTKHTSSRP